MSGATVFLVRHGRTALNAGRVLRGRIDAPLDEVGRREARLLAGVFDGAGLIAIRSSPPMRAMETAAAIAEATGLEVDGDDALIDWDYGRWAASPQEEVESEFGSREAAPGVEALDGFSLGVIDRMRCLATLRFAHA